MAQYSIKIYQTAAGKKPLSEWMSQLADLKARAAIDLRIERVKLGNFGTFEPVGDGVFELKIYIGPGYRIYFSKVGMKIVLLLCAGSKKSQQNDIEKAKRYFEDYKLREG